MDRSQDGQEVGQQCLSWCNKMTQLGSTGLILLVVLAATIILLILINRNKRHPLTVNVTGFTHTAYGNFFLVGLGIIWASVVSVFSTELKAQWFGSSPWGGESLVFGISVLFTLLLGFMHYLHTQYKERQSFLRPSYDSVKESSTQTWNLMKILDQCMRDFRLIAEEERKQKGSVFGRSEQYEAYNRTLDNAITTAIDSVLLIARAFIEGSDDVVIKVNMFNVVPADKVKNDFAQREYPHSANSIFNKDAVLSSPFFLFSSNLDSRLDFCDYLLICDSRFTRRISGIHSPGKDDDVNGDHLPFCMPLSFTRESSKLDASETLSVQPNHPNFFGAPDAVITRREAYIESISKSVEAFINSIEKSTVYSRHITGIFEERIRAYYEGDKDKPRSILSMPVFKYALDSESITIPKNYEQVACVLNIYVDRENFLENSLKSESFYALTRPVCDITGMLISLKLLYASEVSCYTMNNKSATANSEVH